MVNQLGDRRRHTGLTQQQLADLAGASRSMVRLLEQGYEPRRGSDVRERILRVLDELEGSGQPANGQHSLPAAASAAVDARVDGISGSSDLPLHERPVRPERPS